MSAAPPEQGTAQNKLRSRHGLTLMEMLLSLALMSLLAVGVSTGISAAAVAQRDSVALSEASLLLDSVTKAVIGELRYADGVYMSSVPPVPPAGYKLINYSEAAYLSAVYGQGTRFYTVENAQRMPRIFVESEAGDYPILGEGAYSNLGAKIVSLTYDASTGHFSVKLEITLPSGTRQEYPEFEVYPVFQD